MLTGLSQRVAYFYPTGVTLLHTSSPSSLRARLRAVAWAWVCIEVTRAPVAGWGLVRHRARLHQPWGRAQFGQEEHPGPEPCLLGRGAPVVAWQGNVHFKKQKYKPSLWHCKWSFNLFYFLWSSWDASTTWLSKFNSLDIQSFALPDIYWDLLIFFPGWCEVCEHRSHVLRAGGCQLQRRTLSVEVERTWTLQECTGEEFSLCEWNCQKTFIFHWNTICICIVACFVARTQWWLIKCWISLTCCHLSYQNPSIHHPRVSFLGLANEKITLLSANSIRATVATETNKVDYGFSSPHENVCTLLCSW